MPITLPTSSIHILDYPLYKHTFTASKVQTYLRQFQKLSLYVDQSHCDLFVLMQNLIFLTIQ